MQEYKAIVEHVPVPPANYDLERVLRTNTQLTRHPLVALMYDTEEAESHAWAGNDVRLK